MLLETNANGEAKVPSDYKIHCFGKTQYIQVDTDRFVEHTRSIFDENWSVMPFSLCYPQSTTPPSKPLNLMTMLTIATRLSMPFAMLRVDLYNIQGKIIVGNYTLHTAGEQRNSPRTNGIKNSGSYGNLHKIVFLMMRVFFIKCKREYKSKFRKFESNPLMPCKQKHITSKLVL